VNRTGNSCFTRLFVFDGFVLGLEGLNNRKFMNCVNLKVLAYHLSS